MGCPYYNREKSNVINGEWCDYIGKPSKYGCCTYYCKSDNHFHECPYLGGSDPHHVVIPKPKSQPKSSGSSSNDSSRSSGGSSYSSGGSSTPHTGGKSGGSGSLLLFIIIGVIILFTIDDLGIFRGKVDYTINLPENQTISDYHYYTVSQRENGLKRIRKMKTDDSGQGEFKMRTGTYAFAYRKDHDYQVLYSPQTPVSILYTQNVNLEIPESGYYAIEITAKDESSNIIAPASLQLDYSSIADQVESLYQTQDTLVLIMNRINTGDTITLAADGYESAMDINLDAGKTTDQIKVTFE